MTALLEKSDSTTTDAAAALVLTAAHRCDSGACGAQARSHVVFPGGLSLTFCRHHTEDMRASLELKGATVNTQYEGLENRLNVSA